MGHHESHQPDYGTGQKTLGIYVAGVLGCTVLTLFSFWVVMAGGMSKAQTFTAIYVSAIIQFFVQVICFLRLNTQTEQSRMNVMSLVFTGIILLTIVVGTLWIMHNLQFNML
jgi:cytochrome o ubiquinol oxidase operon protein cyoD